jgi:hypothetical protein
MVGAKRFSNTILTAKCCGLGDSEIYAMRGGLPWEPVPWCPPGLVSRTDETAANGAGITSVIPFINNEVFEPTDIKLTSDAYNKAIDDIYRAGHLNKIVEEVIATRIIKLTKGGEREPDRLCARALASCGLTRFHGRQE